MTDNPESIIDEYLALVREKLPESIADDVITELETYMLETARDQGEDGQITFESAKKVVAQFGAPGEVADEYRFSMFPESIPEEDIPKEIVLEPINAEEGEMNKIELPPKKIGVDPTVTYSSFFCQSFVLTGIWAIIVTITTTFAGPIWNSGWYWTIIVGQVILVVVNFYIHCQNLKKNKTILWKRSYPNWSRLQILATLPENTVPNIGKVSRVLDIALSCIWLYFISTIGFHYDNYQWFNVFIVFPVIVLFITRILIDIRRIDEERNPSEMARFEFITNFALLIFLDSTFYWLSYNQIYLSDFTLSIEPVLSAFILLFGALLLFQVVTGAENLWWKAQDESRTKSRSKQIIDDHDKKELIDRLPNTAGRLYARIILWIIVFSAIPIYLSTIYSPSYMFYEFSNNIAGVLIGISVAGFLLIFYFLFRYVMIRKFNFVRIIGQRTRVEAIIDGFVSSLLLFFSTLILLFNLDDSFLYNIINYQEQLGSFQLSYLIGTMEIIASILLCIGFIFRLFGDAMEFGTAWKKRAARWIEQSGILLVGYLTITTAVEYFKYIAMDRWYGLYNMAHWTFLLFVLFLAFQVGTSSMKLKMMKKGNHDTKTPDAKEVIYRIGN